MNPFIAIAVSVLPDILKYVVGSKAGDEEKALTSKIIDTVQDVTKETDVEKARDFVPQTPAAAAELKIRLAEIAATQEQARLDAERQEREQQLAALDSQRAHELSVLSEKIAHEQATTAQKLDSDKAQLEDTRAARAALHALTSQKSPIAWAAPLLSVIIVLGFFGTLFILLDNRFQVQANEQKLQIINIVIGALTAGFATVISFWMGSSQGSKNKDMASFSLRQGEAETAQKQAAAPQTVVARAAALPPAQTAAQAPVAPKQERFANESDFPHCVGIILASEGGYVDHPSDPGGATNMGITFETLKAWRKQPITKQDVKDLTRAEAEQIYHANYWSALSCEKMPRGVDLVVFDFGVNAGVNRSAKTLQQVVGAAQDGMVGPITLAAVDAVDPAHIITRFSQLRMQFYRSLSTWPTFGKGWTARTEKTEKEAESMLA